MGSVGDSSIYIESAASWPSAIVGEIVGVCKGRLADIFLLHPYSLGLENIPVRRSCPGTVRETEIAGGEMRRRGDGSSYFKCTACDPCYA